MKNNLPDKQSNFILYTGNDGKVNVEVFLKDETVWLTQKAVGELFGKERSVITKHLKNIFNSGELEEKSNVQKMHFSHSDKPIKFYNLDVIISVGYRVNSHQATKFRIWATRTLKEYIIKGFVLDDERLKNPDHPFDYFDELLRRIQDIRTSERRFYQKITDIYATSVDYDPTLDMSIEFFKTVQNKMHWAITGKTAAEIIHERADNSKPNMGLTSWRSEKVRKQDVIIAKNYLDEQELLALNNLVEQYLIFAEGQAMRRISMAMQDWIKKLDGFLALNDRNVLSHAGKISHEMAKELAEKEYEEFHVKRIEKLSKSDSDFDKTVKLIEKKKKKDEQK